MDVFIEGVYGYNRNMTIEQNKQYYNQMGYNIACKTKDTTIYMIVGIVGFIIFLIIWLNMKSSDYHEKFKTEK